MMKTERFNRFWNSTLFIVLIYIISGVLWILLSDKLVLIFSANKELLYFFQISKGLFYVVFTGILLYYLVRRLVNRSKSYIRLLNHQNDLLNFILNHQTGTTVWVIEPNGNIIFASGNDEILLPQNYLNTNIFAVDSKEDWMIEIIEHVKQTLITGTSNVNIEINNSIYKFKCDLYAPQIRTPFICAQFFDITDATNLQELNNILKSQVGLLGEEIGTLNHQLKNQITFHQSILNTSPYSLIINHLDNNGCISQILEVNLETSLLLNTNRNELMQNNFTHYIEFHTENDKEKYLNNDFNHANTLTLPIVVPPKNNTTSKQVVLNTRLIHAQDKRFVITTLQNITETVNQINLLKAPILQNNNLLNYSNQGIALLDVHFKPIYFNQGFKTILGVEPDQIHHTSLVEYFINQGLVDLTGYFKNVLNIPEVIVTTQKIANKPIWLDIKLVQIKYIIPQSIICIVTDVSDNNRLKNELVECKKTIAKDEYLRKSFLSNLSHEIRTPMNGILGFVELLETEYVSELFANYLHYIKNSASQLLTILDDIIEISKLENKQFTPINNLFSPSQIIKELVAYTDNLLTIENKRNIQITSNYNDFDNTLFIYSDQEHITRALIKICDNAVKFTNHGTIDISIMKNDNSIEFSIRDSGVGFDPVNNETIFLPFVTFRNSPEEVRDGIGLGLAITKAIVRHLRGSVTVNAKINKGAHFIVNIPINDFKRDIDSTFTNTINFSGKKVLVVQYGFNSADDLRDSLKPYEITVLQAYDGMNAIEMYYNQQDFDLIISDIRLSDMDAFELIRSISRINKYAIMVAQTPYLLNDELRKCMDAGFVDYVLKPIDKSVVLNLFMNQYATISDKS